MAISSRSRGTPAAPSKRRPKGGTDVDLAAETGQPSRSDDPGRAARVAERAHAIWEREGRPDGQHEHHWQMAEAEDRDMTTKPSLRDDGGTAKVPRTTTARQPKSSGDTDHAAASGDPTQ
ncbi:DUF2934 domain-containing protein [Frigidibacter sp. MR17.14]|uniref:DUF2934 domain-containing protein n=1 Tax=Frigidibacter sp. MR17.14 TaxID=3126509 RepID=UPI003012BCB8